MYRLRMESTFVFNIDLSHKDMDKDKDKESGVSGRLARRDFVIVLLLVFAF